MATFEVQVEGVTGLTITSSSVPTQDELTQFLRDGVLDVTDKTIVTNPMLIDQFIRETSESTSQAGISNEVGRVFSVVRESGTDGDWRACRPTSISLQSRVTDVDSLHYASKYSPAYAVGNNGAISVFPAPSAGGADSYKVYYVNSDPMDNDDNNLTYSSNAIKYFPQDKERLVVLYASIKALELKMADYAITEEDTELVTAISSNIGTLQNQYMESFIPFGQQRGGRGEEDEG